MEPQFTKTPAPDHLDDLLELVRRLADNSEQLAHRVRRTTTAIENIAKEGKVIYQAVAPLYERFESLRAGRPIMVRSEVRRTEVRAHPGVSGRCGEGALEAPWRRHPPPDGG